MTAATLLKCIEVALKKDDCNLGVSARVLLPEYAKWLAQLIVQVARDAEEIARLTKALADWKASNERLNECALREAKARDAAEARLNVARSILGRIARWNPAEGEDARHWARDALRAIDAAPSEDE
jgi:hypothetical protein